MRYTIRSIRRSFERLTAQTLRAATMAILKYWAAAKAGIENQEAYQ
jgi:hypothetical protein